MVLREFRNDISIVLCGEAGQGVQTIEHGLTRILASAGFPVFSTSEFMSRIRGGANSTEVRVASRPIAGFVRRIDLLMPLSAGAIQHLAGRISPETLVVGDPALCGNHPLRVEVDIAGMARQAGGPLYANTVATGLLLALFGVDRAALDAYLGGRFSGKPADVLQKNVHAGTLGHNCGRDLVTGGTIAIDIPKSSGSADSLVMSGAEAVALGAVAGGCDFVSSYPMSPSTDVLSGMAGMAHEFDILVEQAEDEIAAVNMALGAWYAGARALVTTAGGGFALMCEGISLAGMIETPVVVHIGQRPGPATGLPTRTEQADLELALYAGHGEFPRVIYAPGNLTEAFSLTRTAFDTADRFQVPAFVLADQFLLDSHACTPAFDLPASPPAKEIVETGAAYRRYALTPTGISPRGIPGWGNGIVCVDSDEHTEDGYITESADVRVAMVNKRLVKATALAQEALPPSLVGNPDAATLVVCWGSARPPVEEALLAVGRDDVAMLHFSQVFPLRPDTGNWFAKARRVVVIEGNATGQFGRLLEVHAGVRTYERMLKYDGMPWSVEEITDGIHGILGKEARP